EDDRATVLDIVAAARGVAPALERAQAEGGADAEVARARAEQVRAGDREPERRVLRIGSRGCLAEASMNREIEAVDRKISVTREDPELTARARGRASRNRRAIRE